MKFSEVVSLVEAFDDDYLSSPSMMSVRFGCDCGCGGDSYTEWEWDRLEEEGLKAKKEVVDFCHKFGIEYDYDEVEE